MVPTKHKAAYKRAVASQRHLERSRNENELADRSIATEKAFKALPAYLRGSAMREA